jgi:hypothetical protein
MAKRKRRRSVPLNAARRNRLPSSKFALPGRRAYPIDTKARARNAKARASQQYNKGNLSRRALGLINARADRVLGR